MNSIVEDICASPVNYWAAYATDFSCPCLFAYLGTHEEFGWPAAVIAALLGLLVFSFVEYAVHRWLLHHRGSTLFYLHDAHHKDPARTSAFLFPMSLAVFLPIWWLLREVHVPAASFFMMGVSGGYFYFDTLHHLEHQTRINQLPFRWLKKTWAFHSVHHRIDYSNFGVTTSLWDYVFGTQQRQLKRRS